MSDERIVSLAVALLAVSAGAFAAAFLWTPAFLLHWALAALGLGLLAAAKSTRRGGTAALLAFAAALVAGLAAAGISAGPFASDPASSEEAAPAEMLVGVATAASLGIAAATAARGPIRVAGVAGASLAVMAPLLFLAEFPSAASVTFLSGMAVGPGAVVAEAVRRRAGRVGMK